MKGPIVVAVLAQIPAAGMTPLSQCVASYATAAAWLYAVQAMVLQTQEADRDNEN